MQLRWQSGSLKWNPSLRVTFPLASLETRICWLQVGFLAQCQMMQACVIVGWSTIVNMTTAGKHAPFVSLNTQTASFSGSQPGFGTALCCPHAKPRLAPSEGHLKTGWHGNTCGWLESMWKSDIHRSMASSPALCPVSPSGKWIHIPAASHSAPAWRSRLLPACLPPPIPALVEPPTVKFAQPWNSHFSELEVLSLCN